jgi:HAD superfamily hydrolase (TIGR01509 family)
VKSDPVRGHDAAPAAHAAGAVDRFRLVAFDLDGVLVDSFDCWWRLLNETLTMNGKQPITHEEFAATWGQDVEADRRGYFPEWPLGRLIEHYTREFPRFADLIVAEPGARPLLESLKRQGKTVAVASNAPVAMVRRLLEQTGLAPFVDWAAGVDLVANGKPEPDLIQWALQQANARNDESCFVGDSEYDALAARAARVHFIGYRRPGDDRVESLRDLIPASGRAE